MTKSFPIKSSPQIRNTYLCPFEEPNLLSILKTYNIIETGKIFRKQVDQSGSGMVCSLYTVCEAAIVFLQAIISDEKLPKEKKKHSNLI
jgi:hypothetical protein